MKFNFFFAIVLLSVTFSATEIYDNSERVTLKKSVRPYFLNKKDCTCNGWEQGVQQCYEGCASVFKTLSGPTEDISENFITSFKVSLDKLKSLTKCNSTIVSKSSTAVLEVISWSSSLGTSPSYLLNELGKVIPKSAKAYRDLVSTLSKSIGNAASAINEVITDLEKTLIEILKQFKNRFSAQKEVSKKMDFVPTMKTTQLLVNTLALIAETALSNCGAVTIHNDVYDALSTLILLSNDILLTVHGINVLISSVLESEKQDMTDFHSTCILTLDPLIQSFAKSITLITMDTAKSARDLLASIVDLTQSFNTAMDDVLGSFEGTKISVGQIKRNFLLAQG